MKWNARCWMPIFFVFAFLSSQNIFAQNKKAFAELQKARAAVSNDDLPKTWMHIQKALKIDPNYFDALVFAGDFMMNEEKPAEATAYYRKALQAKNAVFVKYKLGIALRDNLQYAEAYRLMQDYALTAQIPKDKEAEFNVLMLSLDFASQAIKTPVDFKPIDMGPNINTAAMEYFPSVNARGDVLVFTSRMTTGDKQDEDFFESKWLDGSWQKALRLEGFLNTHDNEGAQALSADGTELYFAGCQRQDGFGSCDIYVSYLRNDLWTKPKNLGPNVNTGSWESQPSISPDGQTLYFVRGKSGYTTQVNIMQSKRQRDGSWGKAEMLPGLVNTQFKDETPFIHFDNQTLYFTSNGHPGFGGKDLFYSKKQADGTWGKPINLGYPINTPKDEFGLVVGPDGKTAYFASNRQKGGEDLDIFYFELPEQSRANEIAWVLGRVVDAETGRPLRAQVDFYDLSEKTPFQQLPTDDGGNFFAVMPANKNFAVLINKEGYLPYSENYDLSGVDTERNYTIAIKLNPIKTGTIFTLNNVLFDTDSYNLKTESEIELDRLVAFLKANPALQAEIQGHTDNQGSPAYNQKLSEQRAKAVMDYLIERGADAKLLKSKGFGDTKPVADNNTERGRKQNRRTDVVLK